jgi:hypothetical protein
MITAVGPNVIPTSPQPPVDPGVSYREYLEARAALRKRAATLDAAETMLGDLIALGWRKVAEAES